MEEKDFQKVNNKQIHHHQQQLEKQNNPKDVTDPTGDDGGENPSSLLLFIVDCLSITRPSQSEALINGYASQAPVRFKIQ
jgi:hypothetical protein